MIPYYILLPVSMIEILISANFYEVVNLTAHDKSNKHAFGNKRHKELVAKACFITCSYIGMCK